MASVIKSPQSRDVSPQRRASRQNFETWSWLFMRVSGIILFFLALVHFFIMHILHDVTTTTVAFVAARYQNPLWKIFDWLLLSLGLLHGTNGLRYIMDDYVRSPLKRVLVKSTVYGVSGILFFVGTLTIITFK
ncbi:succinate dehydrogenase / fumarate reductase membrane anchor subunit [Ferrithrix thermotolerans DSM 19514]|jgi:succinate dehydrogenase / fumarate reductase membrane anchor subunit|uniref:Succinate dehydrogenase / fumarate reductase membrane anchor subunit n=1 Tax=Ferrithrix thermotolerans DSM 19514 TaxID=1121881 RepID=A0A1M4TZ82_9ACTN|nr:succinate dehydrogenase hydrophobic membrane anchor subunit [Ferrithrix thermotolerans]SHE49673.1 succinate dehydrogenase / fumarate reductase membrane anchor subunit [Ferrithrix thermotolerans DSM 19514]